MARNQSKAHLIQGTCEHPFIEMELDCESELLAAIILSLSLMLIFVLINLTSYVQITASHPTATFVKIKKF